MSNRTQEEIDNDMAALMAEEQASNDRIDEQLNRKKEMMKNGGKT
jgi:hypothetical protein